MCGRKLKSWSNVTPRFLAVGAGNNLTQWDLGEILNQKFADELYLCMNSVLSGLSLSSLEIKHPILGWIKTVLKVCQIKVEIGCFEGVIYLCVIGIKMMTYVLEF